MYSWYNSSIFHYSSRFNLGPLYHGTSLSNGLSILMNGFDPSSGYSEKTESYFTPNLDLGLFYSVWDTRLNSSFTDFILFEVYLSHPKRFKRLRYDPLDRDSDFFGPSSSREKDFSLYKSTISSFSDSLHVILPNYNTSIIESYLFHTFFRSGDFNHPFRNEDQVNHFSVESLTSNMNLFKILSNLLVDFNINKSDFRYNRISSLFRGYLNRYWSDYIYCDSSGNFGPSDLYWLSREQIDYSETLPPSVIKGVYINSSFLEDVEGDIEFHRPKMLPGMSSDVRDFVMQIVYSFDFDEYFNSCHKYYNNDDPDDISYYREDLKRYISDILADISSFQGPSGRVISYYFKDFIIECDSVLSKLSSLSEDLLSYSSVREILSSLINLSENFEVIPFGEHIKMPSIETKHILLPDRSSRESLLSSIKDSLITQESLKKGWYKNV